ncbi:hypothetical protein B0O99DRAFT_620222 [Bisporella sp. PMI_857]|nr:hypothetical protein B0O99DRAFT_620222 [Bisporella sp. PMI_857]
MCGITTVYYRCGHYGSPKVDSCGGDPRPEIPAKDVLRLITLNTSIFTHDMLSRQLWCEPFASNTPEELPMIHSRRLCILCRRTRRDAWRNSPDTKKRHDWKYWKAQLPDPEEAVKHTVGATPSWDTFAECDKAWQMFVDVDESTWRFQRNEVMGWE